MLGLDEPTFIKCFEGFDEYGLWPERRFYWVNYFEMNGVRKLINCSKPYSFEPYLVF